MIRAVFDPVVDVLAVTATAMILLLWADPDGSIWRTERAKSAGYARALAACANGTGFRIGWRIVDCIVTDVRP